MQPETIYNIKIFSFYLEKLVYKDKMYIKLFELKINY